MAFLAGTGKEETIARRMEKRRDLVKISPDFYEDFVV